MATISAEEFGRSPDRPADRQAVVIIHGIGEQWPMSTLRGLIEGLFPRAAGEQPHYYSKPDRLSDTLELRRMHVDGKVAGRPTDFYELYWAHLMAGTTLQHVTDWFFVLLLRGWHSVPKRLRWIWIASWVAAIILVVVGVVAVWKADTRPALGAAGLLAVLVFAGRFLAKRFALSHIGDAARYLRPAPENIAIRGAVRSAGLDLLRRLHEDPMQRYERIVLVGHSLGSVIAYDVLTYLWQEVHWKHNKPLDPKQPKFSAMQQRLAAHPGHAGWLDDYRALQSELLAEERELGMPWKVTDLITLGSPLTYADFLLADHAYPLKERCESRELPTCPPQLEDGRDVGFLSPSYVVDIGRTSKKRQLHHGAVFACTRWTNLYFKADIVGGPVAGQLGDGIKDVEVPPSGLVARTYASHVLYWSSSEPLACRLLRDALNLGHSLTSTLLAAEVRQPVTS